MVTPALIDTLRAQFPLRWDGLHGLPHWARVLENGLRVAEETGADVDVVTLFAVFHDARRLCEGLDHEHGQRGAQLAASLNGQLFTLDGERAELLYYACSHHTDGLTEGDITVQTCWDADRLDLARAGIIPDPSYLCTAAARNPTLIRWAKERSDRLHVPPLVASEWLQR